MNRNAKSASAITIADLEKHPVWEYLNSDEGDETAVGPVANLPVATMSGRLVGTRAKLANGNRVWVLLGNITEKDPHSTEQFLSASIYNNATWFFLSRDHDPDYARKGSQALAEFLQLRVEDVFPISYDITPFVKGDPHVLVGKILAEPKVRLTEEELIALAIR